MERREFIEPRELRPMAERLARRWSDVPLRFVRNFENAVYELGSSPVLYLRLTPTTHHTPEEVASELDFVQFLGESSIAVAQPVPARDGTLLCTAALAGLGYTACVFEQAPGLSYEACAELDHSTFFFNAGRLMAQVHEAGLRYRPGPEFTRFSWLQDRWSRFAELVPEREMEAWTMYEEVMAWTASQARDPAHFGLIHGDYTIANLRLGPERITLFDLDSCCAHWHAYELAVFLHYFGARPLLRRLAYERVLEGYAQERPIGERFLAQIPIFGKMRLLYSFLVFATEWGFEGLTEEQEAYFDLRRRLFSGPPLWPEGPHKSGLA